MNRSFWDTLQNTLQTASDTLVHISGHVVDQVTGDPLPNVEVYQMIAGSRSGTTTNAQGYYDLVAVPAVNVHVQHVAYDTYTQAAPLADGTMNVALVPAQYVLPEVEVHPGSTTTQAGASWWGYALLGVAGVGLVWTWIKSR